MKEINNIKTKLAILKVKSIFYKTLNFLIELLGNVGVVAIVASIIGLFFIGIAIIIAVIELPKWLVLIGALVIGLVMTIYGRVRNED